MSLIPRLYQPYYYGSSFRDWPQHNWSMVPSSIFGQHFGMDVADEMLHEMDRIQRSSGFRPMLGDLQRSMQLGTGEARLVNNDERFAVSIDVQQFKPEEIKVKTHGDQLVIEATHEERPDEHGLIKRHFVRKYSLPKNVDMAQLKSHLGSDGLLTVEALKKVPEGIDGVRHIPIERGPAVAPVTNAGQQQQETKKK